MIDWQPLLTYFISTTLITGGVVYLAKVATQAFFNGAQERYKLQLAHELERHKHELARYNHEHSVRYAALHAERAEVIKVIYNRMTIAFGAIDMQATLWINGSNVANGADHLRLTLAPLIDHFTPNRIYLDEPLCKKVEGFINCYQFLTSLLVDFEKARVRGEITASDRQQLADAMKGVRDVLAGAKSQLEATFREALGLVPAVQSTD